MKEVVDEEKTLKCLTLAISTQDVASSSIKGTEINKTPATLVHSSGNFF